MHRAQELGTQCPSPPELPRWRKNCKYVQANCGARSDRDSPEQIKEENSNDLRPSEGYLRDGCLLKRIRIQSKHCPTYAVSRKEKAKSLKQASVSRCVFYLSLRVSVCPMPQKNDIFSKAFKMQWTLDRHPVLFIGNHTLPVLTVYPN